MTDSRYYYGLGKRKTARAKVRLYTNGSGNITINGRDINEYVPTQELRNKTFTPLRLTNTNAKFNISILTSGGGMCGQVDAIIHGIARALVEFDPNLRSTLKKAGYLRRDARKKERKKPGLKKARRASQFSKR